LRGTIETVAGGDAATVRFAGGQVLAAHSAGAVRAGDAADVVIHPEDCLLAPQGAAPAANQWSVRVTARRFAGTSTRYTVDWSGSEVDVVVLGTAAAQIEAGATAILSIAPDAARIVAPDDPDTEAA
jgi:ABC-type Fe3+/spermidine/putrescine transport system ATPase subunit